MDEDKITISKSWLLVMATLLVGGSSFTGYAVKSETVHIGAAEIKNIMRDELKPIELQTNSINNQVSVLIYKQAEFERRLESLERVNRNAR